MKFVPAVLALACGAGGAFAQDPRAWRYEPVAIAHGFNAYHHAVAARNANPTAETNLAVNYAHWGTALVLHAWTPMLDQYLDGSVEPETYLHYLRVSVELINLAHWTNHAALVKRYTPEGLHAYIASYYAYHAAAYTLSQGVPPDGLTPELRALRNLHNARRAALGLPRLKIDHRLNAAARGHAAWMAANATISHAGAGGSTPLKRAVAQGYSGAYYGVGENTAFGYPEQHSVFHAWLSSPGHQGNIDRPDFQHLGLAVVTAANGQKYWAVEFGYIR